MGSEVIGIFAVFFIAGIIIGGTALFANNKRKQEIEDSRYRYQDALDNLERDPENLEAKMKATELGNYFYGLTIPDTNVLHYSENGLPIGSLGYQDNSLERKEAVELDVEERIKRGIDKKAA